ncbi:helix-turn-helix transcriptional regulator [Staphylococcus hyicus]|uniref:helix-turn-helix transcriptional regulator n=1 Tax=Staphylococcus TaxID=1279 RepID=UPI00208EFBA3|nr:MULTISPECIES: helix-turn-helix transcriptional regulator [Staphylococcus]MCO4332712.1 helix-turn-helix transcriptional regulator [Staphylococcus hyicus]MCO4351543.1 helix-turn-helix transcriptional regulator [Staphylococcus agnetis]
MKNRVKEFRAKNNWNQDELANKTKTSRQTISLIKRNIMTPSVVTALKLSKVFSINVEELFLLEDKD